MSREEANGIARFTERIRRSRGGMLKLSLPTAAALGVGAAVAIGSIPGSDEKITACYSTIEDPAFTTPYGALRVIDPSRNQPGVPTPVSQCSPSEATIAWNQAGPQGPPGAVGPAGSAGAQGVVGAPGAAGKPLVGQTSFGIKSSSASVFLKLDGIAGESTDAKHKGQISVDSFSLGLGADASGKRTFESFVITKKLDKATPLLFKSSVTGQHIKSAVISFAKKAKGGKQDYLQFKFTDVLISGITSGVNGGSTPAEQVTFTYAKVNETVIGSNGKSQGSVTYTVNQKI